MKRKVYIVLILIMALILLGSGCSRKSDSGYDEAPSPGMPDRDWNSKDPVAPTYPGEGKNPIYDSGGSGSHGQRYDVKTGEIAINVEKIKDSETKIRQYVEGKGGFIASSSFYSDPKGDSQTSYMVIRVPQEFFDSTMIFLDEEVGKKISSSTGKTDVTLQYVDMEARIKNLTRQETRYTEILEQAKTVEEILRIEAELVRIRGDIESLSAQFLYLRDRVGLATISITLRQTVLATPGVTAVGFKGAWQRAVVALTETINTLINGAANVFVLSFRLLPYVLLLLAGFFVLYKFLKRFDRRSGQKAS
jgi:hypothetical protein